MRRPLVLLLAAAAVSPAESQPAPPSTPVVHVDGGRIAGERQPDGRTVFRAVPFAAPPA